MSERACKVSLHAYDCHAVGRNIVFDQNSARAGLDGGGDVRVAILMNAFERDKQRAGLDLSGIKNNIFDRRRPSGPDTSQGKP